MALSPSEVSERREWHLRGGFPRFVHGRKYKIPVQSRPGRGRGPSQKVSFSFLLLLLLFLLLRSEVLEEYFVQIPCERMP